MTAPGCIETAAAPRLRAAWIDSPAALAGLAAEWDALYDRAHTGNAFLTFAWMSTWWKHFGKGRLAVVAVRDPSGCLAALAPFYIARHRTALGARRLAFLADDRAGSDYLDVLTLPELAAAAAEEIARTLLLHRNLWDYLELRDAADSPLLAALAAQLEARGLRARRAPAQICYCIPLPRSFDDFLRGAGIGLRANYNRRCRNLRREHAFECLAVTSADELERRFPSLVALHRMRFEQRRADSAFLAPGLPEFHADALRALAASGLARMFVLLAGGQPVAAMYGFAAGRTFQFYQCGMHPAWMRYGVGQILIGNAIEQCIAAGYATFDFLRGGEAYKTQWTSHSRRTVTWQFFDHRRGSLAARLGLAAAAAIRRAARAVKDRARRSPIPIREH